jgi:uncharacterized protein (TIGR03437 family)
VKRLLLLALIAAAASAQITFIPDSWYQYYPPNTPTQRSAHAMAFDSARGQVVLFGGQDLGGAYLSDTWVWDGTNWTQKFPKTVPPGRISHAMAYDSAHSQVVMFGGFDGNADETNFGDTWVWDGTNWTQQLPQTSPPGRDSFAMAYDSAHSQVVLFGGFGSGFFVFLGDTWVWDGSNWTEKTPQTSPSARADFAMAYDSAHGQAVLFSGDEGIDFPADTWVWDGVNWTNKTSPTVPSPPGRVYHAMAFDSVNNQTVMFGGNPLKGNTFSDTWLWDGSNWTQKHPSASPSPRTGHGMAYDSIHNRTVMFGGNTPDIAPDTWTWYGGAPPPPPPPPPPPVIEPTISNVLSASSFGGFSSAAPGSWMEIYGSNLAPDTRGWAGTDFSGNNAPTSLDGVSVNIGGQAAFVDYISPTQVNAQLPSGIATSGALALTVSSGGVTGAPYNLTVNPTQPGLLASAQFKIGANQYVVAQLPDGNYVLPAGAIANVNSRPAKPGETIVIYGIGFGAVTPVIPAGEIVTQTNQLSSNLQISFGGTPAVVPYAGLAPGFVGLYQFNVTVPSVTASSPVPLTFSLDGVAGTQTLVTSVQE